MSIEIEIGRKVSWWVYAASVKSQHGVFESGLAIFNRQTPQSAVSSVFLKALGVRSHPIPPGNELNSAAFTPLGVFYPERYAEISFRSIKCHIGTTALKLVVLNDNIARHGVDLFVGGKFFETLPQRGQRLFVVDSDFHKRRTKEASRRRTRPAARPISTTRAIDGSQHPRPRIGGVGTVQPVTHC